MPLEKDPQLYFNHFFRGFNTGCLRESPSDAVTYLSPPSDLVELAVGFDVRGVSSSCGPAVLGVEAPPGKGCFDFVDE